MTSSILSMWCWYLLAEIQHSSIPSMFLSFTSFIPTAWHRALVLWFQGCLALVYLAQKVKVKGGFFSLFPLISETD